MLVCEHCLLPVKEREAVYDDFSTGRKVFCCHACRAINRLIVEEGLGAFYKKRAWRSSGIPEAFKSVTPPGRERSEEKAKALDLFIRGEGVIKEADLMLDGIRCASCVWLNERILERTEGVVSARINFATHRLHITWDSDKTDLGRIIARMRSIGYLARPYTPAAREQALKKESRNLLVRLGTASFFSMQLMMVSFGLYAGYFQGIEPVAKSLLEVAAFLACTPVLFYSGLPFLQGAFRGLKNRVLNMDLLITIGALSAYVLSVHHMLSGGETYFDTAAMIITLVLLGRFLEHSAKRTASEAVSRLVGLQPRETRIIRGLERSIVSTDEVRKGDMIEVLPGEKIPLDGVVCEGMTEVDESLVTGEAAPREKAIGSEVIGGSINGPGSFIMEVTRTGGDTVLAQIARLVEKAQAATAPVQRFADTVSMYFIPFVLTVAVGTYLYWSRQTAGAAPAMNAVSVLVIACPCALGLATPVAVLAGTGRAARSGILIKGGDVLERMHKVDTVVLDKTGTVTTGKMNVVKVRNADCGMRKAPHPDPLPEGARVISERPLPPGERIEVRGDVNGEILQYAASAEQCSEHLMGQAIVNYAKEQGIELYKSDSFKAEPGRGVKATVNGMSVCIGKRALMDEAGVQIEPDILSEAEKLEQAGGTVVWVSRDTILLGTIALMDSPKPDAFSAIEQLKNMKLDVAIITGDNQSAAQVVAEKTGIRSIAAGVSPAGKSEEISRMRKQGKIVAMVGDGINDAPALAAADVGIAMSTGSDIAMESADVVLMRSDLSSIVQAIEISRKTFTIIKQNLFWAFFYNVAAIPLAMAGVLSPIVAAAAMALSSVTVVTNSLRLR